MSRSDNGKCPDKGNWCGYIRDWCDGECDVLEREMLVKERDALKVNIETLDAQWRREVDEWKRVEKHQREKIARLEKDLDDISRHLDENRKGTYARLWLWINSRISSTWSREDALRGKEPTP